MKQKQNNKNKSKHYNDVLIEREKQRPTIIKANVAMVIKVCLLFILMIMTFGIFCIPVETTNLHSAENAKSHTSHRKNHFPSTSWY